MSVIILLLFQSVTFSNLSKKTDIIKSSIVTRSKSNFIGVIIIFVVTHLISSEKIEATCFSC